MAYELTITPNRGVFSLVTVGNPVTGLEVPTSYSGAQSTGFIIDRVPGLTVNGNPSLGAITFNNANLQNVTQITVTSDTSAAPAGLAPGWTTGSYIQTFNTANFEEFALFLVDSESRSSDLQTVTLNVTHISSTVTSFSSGDFLACDEQFASADIKYVATPNYPLTVTGSLRSINGILQTPNLAGWTEFTNDYDIETVGRVNYLINLRKSPTNTSDVDISYSITKNGVAHQNFLVTLKHKTAAELRNPGGLPS